MRPSHQILGSSPTGPIFSRLTCAASLTLPLTARAVGEGLLGGGRQRATWQADRGLLQDGVRLGQHGAVGVLTHWCGHVSAQSAGLDPFDPRRAAPLPR